MARQWHLSAWCLGFLLLTGGLHASERMPTQFVGMVGESAINLTLEQTVEDTVTGKVEQAWIDAAGQQKSGTADIQGTWLDGVATLYLTPEAVIRLPIILTARWTEAGLAVQGGALNETGDLVSVLHPGSDAVYRVILKQLPAPKSVSDAQEDISLLEELQKTGVEGGEGCQCSAEKKTHVAEATIAFSEQTARLLANLDDYLAGIEATRKVLDTVVKDQNGRQSRVAFTDVFQVAGRDIATSLNKAVEKCSHRKLAERDVVTREAKLWRDTCLSAAGGLDRYRNERNVFPTSLH